MITETFGDILFYPESECLDEFPSPEELKYRVIISTKPPKEYLQAEIIREAEDQSSKKRRDSNGSSLKTQALEPVDHEEEEEAEETVHKSYFFFLFFYGTFI